MFDFYTIDINYMAFLYSYDTEVYFMPTSEYKEKPYVGIIMMIDNFNYFIPLTSAKTKHKMYKNSGVDYNLIFEYEKRKNTTNTDITRLFSKDLNGNSSEDVMEKILSMLDFRKAVPVSKGFYSRIIIKGHINQDLLNKEYNFLLKKSKSLESKSRNIINKQKADLNIKKAYCNFSLLESKCREWARKKLQIELRGKNSIEIKRDQNVNLDLFIRYEYGVIKPIIIDTSTTGKYKYNIDVVNEFNDLKSIDIFINIIE